MTSEYSHTLYTANVAAVKRHNIILLHGLFGNLSNWEHVHTEFCERNNVYIPQLPLFDISLTENRLDSLVSFLKKYIESKNLQKVVLVGNSLGGHIALMYTLKYPDKVEKLILTGSSGLYENSFHRTFPRVKDYDYIKEKVERTFYRKEVVTDSLLNEVYQTVQSPAKVLSIISLARAAQRHNLLSQLERIYVPALFLWGLQDDITPPQAAVQFSKTLPDAELIFIDKCGHVPMMEQPLEFNYHMSKFLAR